MDSHKKTKYNYDSVMSRVFNRSRSSLRSGSYVTRHEVASSLRVGAKPSVSAVSSGVFSELPTVLNDYVPDLGRDRVSRRAVVKPRRTLKSLDVGKMRSPQRTSRERAMEYDRNIRARGSAPVLSGNGEEWAKSHVRQCYSSRSHTRLKELKDEIKAFHETDKQMKLRSHLFAQCGVVLDDTGCVLKEQGVQVSPEPDEENSSIRRLKWLRLMEREDLMTKNAHHYYACEKHFNPQDICQRSVRKILKKTAYPCFHLPNPTKHDKQMQTELISLDSFTQTEIAGLQNTTEIVLMTSSSSSSCKTVMNMMTSSDTMVQTDASLSADTPRKRKMKSELEGCQKLLRVEESEVKSQTSSKDMFYNLCDRLLTKDLAELVKTQTILKPEQEFVLH